MTNLKGVKAGDELIHTSKNWSPRHSKAEPKKVFVHKVGTKLVHILRIPGSPSSGTIAFRIENGSGSDYREGSLWKPEDFELEKERPALEDALKRPHRIEVWPGQIPVPTLKKLLAVMEESGS